MLRCARTSSVYSHHGSSIRICLCSLFTDNNRRLNKFSTSMICLSTDFYKHNTLVKSSENQEIARITSSSGPVRVLYSRELLIELRYSPLSKVVPPSTLCDINSLDLKRRFRGRRGGRHHQHLHHHEKRRQPAALPNPIPVLTTTRRLCRFSGPGRVQWPALGCELRRANLVDMCQDSYHCPTLQTGLPGVYIINASFIAKPSVRIVQNEVGGRNFSLGGG